MAAASDHKAAKRELGRGERVLPGSSACACRSPGRECPTATPGPSRRAMGSCCSTPASTRRVRWRSSNARSRCATCAWRTCACWSARTRTPITTARRRRSWSGRVANCGCTPTTSTWRAGPRTPTRPSRDAWRSRARAACRRSRCAATPPTRGSHDSGIAAVIAPDRRAAAGRHDSRPTSATGRCTRRRATRPRTSACFSPSGAC